MFADVSLSFGTQLGFTGGARAREVEQRHGSWVGQVCRSGRKVATGGGLRGSPRGEGRSTGGPRARGTVEKLTSAGGFAPFLESSGGRSGTALIIEGG